MTMQTWLEGMAMAFVDTDEFEHPYINLTHRVGAKGDWDDLLVVQWLLSVVYNLDPTFAEHKPKAVKADLQGGRMTAVTVTGKPAPDTPILIADFQRKIHKTPFGYANPVHDRTKASTSTIWYLNATAKMAFRTVGIKEELINRTRRLFPDLAGRLREVSSEKFEH